MLVRFSVSNFLSFKEQTVFSMAAGKFTRHPSHVVRCGGKRLLKGAFLFGANAGGKSNFIKAVQFAADLVLHGLTPAQCNKKYFRIDPKSKKEPGFFQFDLFTNERFYSYGFVISYENASILEEWLYDVTEKNEKCIFHRQTMGKNKSSLNSDLAFSDQEQQIRFDVYKKDIQENEKMSNIFFLNDIVRRAPGGIVEYQPFEDVFKWIGHLIFVFPEYAYMGSFSSMIDSKKDPLSLESLLDYFDTGIEKLDTIEIDFEKTFQRIPPDQRRVGAYRFGVGREIALVEVIKSDNELKAREIVSRHGKEEEPFHFYEESDGTQRLFDLLPIFNLFKNNFVILVDELDRSLHTKAILEFIRLFYEVSKDSHSQLVATTHDSNVLDLDQLRQDEIWFVDRQKNHSSKLYSLDEFKIRFDTKIEKGYLLGRYGAIPLFDKLHEKHSGKKVPND